MQCKHTYIVLWKSCSVKLRGDTKLSAYHSNMSAHTHTSQLQTKDLGIWCSHKMCVSTKQYSQSSSRDLYVDRILREV